MNITEATAIDELARRGFTDWFRVVEGNLRVLTTGKLLKPEDLVIREVYRFEGISDPDDMAIVYAIESTTGIRGTLIDAFDLYADPAAAARVVEGQEPAVMKVGRRVLDASEGERLDGPIGGRDHAVDHLRPVEAFGLQTVHQIVRVVRRHVARRALRLPEEKGLPA